MIEVPLVSTKLCGREGIDRFGQRPDDSEYKDAERAFRLDSL